MGLGFVVAGLCCSRHLQELGKPADWAYEMVFAALVGGLVGARLWWIGENWSDAKDDLLGSPVLRHRPGLVRRGARRRRGGDPWAWRRGSSRRDVRRRGRAAGRWLRDRADRLPALRRRRLRHPLGLPWAMAYPDGTVPTPSRSTRRRSTRRSRWASSPGLWRCAHRLTAGHALRALPGLAGFERLLVEFVRRNDSVVAGLTPPQLLSLAMIAGGIALACCCSGGDGACHAEHQRKAPEYLQLLVVLDRAVMAPGRDDQPRLRLASARAARASARRAPARRPRRAGRGSVPPAR